MKKSIALLLCAIVTMVFTGCTKEEDVLTGTINGLVTDYTNANSPIAGASVTLGTTGLTKTTGSDGRYEFTGIEPGSYTIAVSANNYQPTTKQVTVYAGQTAGCDFQLTAGAVNVEVSPTMLSFGKDTEQLSFTITNKSSRKLDYTISNIPDFLKLSPSTGSVAANGNQAVTVSLVNRTQITTSRNGQFTVNIGNDSYNINVSVDPYQEEATAVEITPTTLAFGKDTEQLSFTITNKSSRKLDYTISNIPDFLKLSPSTGSVATSGVQTVTASLVNRTQITASRNGQFTVNIGNNSYNISVTVEPYQEEAVSVDIHPSTLSFDSETETLSFTMTSAYSKDLAYSIASTLDILTVSPSEGTLKANGQQAVNVTVQNRQEVKELRRGQLNITMGGNKYVVDVSVAKAEDKTETDDPSQVVANGLYAFYTFEDSYTDVTARELGGIGRGTSFVSSYNGTKAMNIPAKESVAFSIPDPLIDQKAMSVSFWAKDLDDGLLFYAVPNTTYDHPTSHVLAVENGQLKYLVSSDYIYYQWSKHPAFMNNQLSGWHMITLTSTHTNEGYGGYMTTTLYLDGSLSDVVTENYNGNLIYAYIDKCVKFIMGGAFPKAKYGNDMPNLNPTSLTIDNLRFYKNRALDADEVKSIYKAEKK